MATTHDETTAAAVDQVAPELDRKRAAEVLAAIPRPLPTPAFVVRHLLGPLQWPKQAAATQATEQPQRAEKPKTKRQRRDLRRKSSEQ